MECHHLRTDVCSLAASRALLAISMLTGAWLDARDWALASQRLMPHLRGAQFTLGFGAYLYPTVAKRHREALGPLHTYLGKATFVAGLANMAVRDSPRIGALSTNQRQTAHQGFSLHL